MKYIYIIFIAIFIASCSSKNETQQNTEVEQINETNISNNIVEFTTEQVDVAGIKSDSLQSVKMSQEIYCTGVIEASPQNIAKVSVPSIAFVDNIYVKHGSYIKKGETVLTIKHNEFIDLQSDYLKLKNELALKKEEFDRQKKLYNENAVSKKKFRQVELDYNTALTEEKNLEQKLILLGLNPQILNHENISSTIALKAPISGYIDEVFVSMGQFIEPKDVLFEIINPTDFNLMLSVYGKYKNSIKIGDKVQFKPCDKHCEPAFAEIYSIGQIVEEETKTFKVHATPENMDNKLTAGSFINAKILVNNTQVDALPSSAVINNEQGSFVFIQLLDNKFEQIKVEVGSTNDQYTEIVNSDLLKNKRIVVTGSNYLFSKLNE